MKNLMNNVDNVLTESLDGFAAAHADIVALGAEHEFVRRKRNKPGKVALISGRGRPDTSRCTPALSAAGVLDAAWPGPDLYLAHAQPDDERWRKPSTAAPASCSSVKELLRRHDEFPDGLRHAGPGERRRRRQRRCGRRRLHRHHRHGAAWPGTLIVEKILGAAAERGEQPGRPQGSWAMRSTKPPPPWAWR
jgi:dihydroxyacetone kinase-like protein